MKRFSVILLLALSLTLVACQPIEKSARDGIAGAKSLLDYYKLEFKCGTPDAGPKCPAVARGVAAKDFAIDVLLVYCAGPSFNSGGACEPSKSKDARAALATKLEAALKDMQRNINDLRGLRGGRR